MDDVNRPLCLDTLLCTGVSTCLVTVCGTVHDAYRPHRARDTPPACLCHAMPSSTSSRFSLSFSCSEPKPCEAKRVTRFGHFSTASFLFGRRQLHLLPPLYIFILSINPFLFFFHLIPPTYTYNLPLSPSPLLFQPWPTSLPSVRRTRPLPRTSCSRPPVTALLTTAPPSVA